MSMWTWIPALLACSDPVGEVSPGRVVARRLNRAEYDNTVRDLLGTTLRPARDTFPADDFSLGFDVIGSVLSVSPLHVELYDQAADAMLDELFGTGTLPLQTWRVEAESGEARHDLGGVFDVTGWVLWDEGAVHATFWLPTSGGPTADYTVAVEAFAQQAGDEPARMSLRVDGVEVALIDVLSEEAPERHEVRLPLGPGAHVVSAAYVNEHKAPPEADRNLILDRFEVTGPHDVPRTRSPAHAQVIPCDPATDGEGPCAERVARELGRRAFRRPLSEVEVAAKLRHYGAVREAGGTWEEGVRGLIRGLLLSPYFLYRIEPDPRDGVRALNGFELASRLSYFLWSSTPDDRLLDLAQSGALVDEAVLAAEARRMLEDPRSDALVDDLAGQWLGVRKVDEASPSTATFPTWDSGLQASMREEMRRYVASVLRADRSVLELFTERSTAVDARLAEHYGVAPPEGEGFAEVEVPDRVGLLARGGLLAALSLPNRTSPVLRGEWVLGNLLCAQPPPPPAGILPLADEPEVELSMREQLAAHRENPSCAACHIEMDAIGLALEGFDATGRAREADDLGLAIDATGELPGLGAFDGATELQQVLIRDPRLPRCMVSKVLTYALGRGLLPMDVPVEDHLLLQFAGSGYRFESLVVDVVRSRPFRYRAGEAP
jgi:hypothetical protein